MTSKYAWLPAFKRERDINAWQPTTDLPLGVIQWAEEWASPAKMDSRHKHRNLPHVDRLVTPADICKLWQYQNGLCALTGNPLLLTRSGERNQRSDFVSVDRISSDIGYSLGNVQLVLLRMNLLKGTTPNSEFVKFLSEVRSYTPTDSDSRE